MVHTSMPPKSQTTSLIGEASRTRYQEVRPLFELARPLAAQDNTAESERANTLGISQNDDPPMTAQIGASTPPVPRSVAVEPNEPVIAKYKGNSLQIRQLWEGTVIEVHDKAFVAVLTDKTRLGTPDEQASFEFESSELSEDDRPLVAPGAVFYWMMGTEQRLSGQVRSISTVEFSRLPMWTQSSLSSASEKASRAKQWFRVNGDRPSEI